MRRRSATAAAAVVLLAGCGLAGAQRAEEPLLVAAAADLRPAFTLLAASFEDATGERVVFSFGSSGQLAQQIVEGAPMDLYASADTGYVDAVLAGGRGDASTRTTYALGRIAIWTRADAWGGWSSLAEAVADPGVRRVAIANPEHAPYGVAARDALISEGLWEPVQPRLVYGENIADTQRLAATGNADVAIVALSLALAADEGAQGRWVLLPATLHGPLRQDLIVVADDPERAASAERFIDHVTGAQGRTVMRRFGLLLPGEAPPASWEEPRPPSSQHGARPPGPNGEG